MLAIFSSVEGTTALQCNMSLIISFRHMGLGNTDDMMVIQFNYKLPVRNIKVPLMALAIVLLTHPAAAVTRQNKTFDPKGINN